MLALTFLGLSYQSLLSAADVLCLLACFPHLEHLKLSHCTIQTASTTALLMRYTRLRTIHLDRGEGEGALHEGTISSLAQWWRWPHEAAEPAIVQYPGLHRADAQLVSTILRSIKFGTLKWKMYACIYS